MLSILCKKNLCLAIILFSLVTSFLRADYVPACGGVVMPEAIREAVKYAGPETETRLKDLMRADYHQGLSQYYLNRGKAGFMALERFQLALEQAVADIREVSFIKDDKRRTQKALEVFQNWQNAFIRAQKKNAPEK